MSHATPMACPPSATMLCGLRLGLGRVQIGDDDPRAPRGESRADLGADAAGPAENHDDFVFVLHGWKIRA